MALTNYLRRRGGTYYGRIAVPTDLVARLGKSEIQQALGKVRDPADAKRKIGPWVQDKRDWFDRLRSGGTLTSEMIEQECGVVARDLLGFLTAERMARPQGQLAGPRDPDDPPDPREIGLGVSLDRFTDALNEDNFAPVREEAVGIVLRLGVTAPEGSEQWVELCRVLLRAHAEAYRVELARHCGDAAASMRLPLNPNLVGAFEGEVRLAPVRAPRQRSMPAVEAGGWTLADAIERYLGAREGTEAWTAKTAHQHRDSVEMFEEVVGGEMPIAAIARQHVADFKALIEQLPTTRGKAAADRNRTLEEIVASCPGGAPRISHKTVKRHLSALSGLFAWTKENGRYEADNPARGFRFVRTRRPRDERPSWSSAELGGLFASPIWTGSASGRIRAQPGTVIVRDHHYWLPLLGVFAGLRLEEACQLQAADIETEDGIAFANIRPGDGKQLKSRAAVRRVPLHPVLLEAGFLRYVEQHAKQGGATGIFPGLRRGGPDRRLGAYVTKEFTAYRRAIGAYERGRDFHALRHSFTTALAEAGVERAVIDELTGHEGTGETSRYTKALPLSQLHAAVRRVDYGFDTAHLRERVKN